MPTAAAINPWLQCLLADLACSQVPDLVNADHARQQGLQVLKRFTGGGTVVVDADTIFTSLILQVGAHSISNQYQDVHHVS